MNDSSIFRAVLLSELFEILKPLVMVLAALLLFYGAVHLLVKYLERKMEPTVREPIQPEQVPIFDDPEFQRWYNALLDQADFSYAEAVALYTLVKHEDVYRIEETTTASHDDGMPL